MFYFLVMDGNSVFHDAFPFQNTDFFIEFVFVLLTRSAKEGTSSV